MNKSKLLILVILNVLLLSVQNRSILTENCIQHEMPQKFGVLTTTYIRSGSTKMFNDYLKRYAESDCDAYDNIYIIWNNQQTPQQMGVLANKDKWKKNVYFMQTVQNSLDFKYIVPTWAKQKIFFSMDDDFDIKCETLKQGFKLWQQSSYGEIGPLTALYGRSFVFEPKTQSFTYIDQVKLNPKWNYFHFSLTGISYISRHFLQLYYADIQQLREMRKHVVQKFNCQDLLLNFMISYLYPEITPKYIELPFISLGFSGVSATAKHKNYRAECITQFSEIIGYNPIRYTLAKKDPVLMQKKTDLHQSCMVNLKQQHYQKTFISNRAYYLYIKRITGVDNDFIRDENVRLLEAKQNIVSFMQKRRLELQKESNLNNNIKSEANNEHTVLDNERKMFGEDEMMVHFGTKQQIDKFDGKFPKTQTKKQISTQQFDRSQTILQQQVSSDSIKKQAEHYYSQLLAFLKSQNDLTIYIAILSALIASIFCIRKLLCSKAKSYQNLPIGSEA